MSELVVSAFVHTSVESTGRVTLLDERSGCWFALNETGSRLWRHLSQLSDVEAATQALVNEQPSIFAEQVRDDAAELCCVLAERGLLVQRRAGHGHSASRPRSKPSPSQTRIRGMRGVPMALEDDTTVGLSSPDRLVAGLALPLAILLLRLPFRHTVRFVRGAKRASCRRPASVAEAYAAMRAARCPAWYFPGRAACLEVSLAAVLAALLRGRDLTWCLGSAADPRRFHAWTEVDGEPVVLAGDESVQGVYRCVLAV